METPTQDRIQDFVGTINNLSVSGDIVVGSIVVSDENEVETVVASLLHHDDNIAVLEDIKSTDSFARNLYLQLQDGKVVVLTEFTPFIKQQLWSLVHDQKLLFTDNSGNSADGTIQMPGAAVILVLPEGVFDTVDSGGIISLVERI